MIHDRRVALIYRSISFVFCIFGILASVDIFGGGFSARMLMYYTLQSNFLILFMFGFLTVKTALSLKKDGSKGSASYAPRFIMICAVDIFLTFIVYWALLLPQSFSMMGAFSPWSFKNLAVHAITPVLCFLDYIFFADGQKLKYRDIYFTLIFPLFYLVFASIAGACGYIYYHDAAGLAVRFPYFFIDYDRIGGMAAVYIIALTAIFVLIGHGLYALDKRWKKKVLFPKTSN